MSCLATPNYTIGFVVNFEEGIYYPGDTRTAQEVVDHWLNSGFGSNTFCPSTQNTYMGWGWASYIWNWDTNAPLGPTFQQVTAYNPTDC